MFNDNKSSYSDLLQRSGYQTMHIKRIKTMVIEVFKCLHKLNPNFINNMFEIKNIEYHLRDSMPVVQPKFDMIRYGKKTFKYYGSHLWNLLSHEIKECMNLNTFKVLIKDWDGPSCQCNMCSLDV